jgi:hypothetical protein
LAPKIVPASSSNSIFAGRDLASMGFVDGPQSAPACSHPQCLDTHSESARTMLRLGFAWTSFLGLGGARPETRSYLG